MTELENQFLEALKSHLYLATQLIDQRIREKKSTSLVSMLDWTMENINWMEAMGKSGPYQRADPDENPNNRDFEFMLEDLVTKGGKMEHGGYFLWKFENSLTVGRKPSRKQL
jgi:hypothetical protein